MEDLNGPRKKVSKTCAFDSIRITSHLNYKMQLTHNITDNGTCLDSSENVLFCVQSHNESKIRKKLGKIFRAFLVDEMSIYEYLVQATHRSCHLFMDI